MIASLVRPLKHLLEEGVYGSAPVGESVFENDDVLRRWMRLEVHGSNASTVTKARELTDLLGEEEPQAQARDGSIHRFDRDALERLAEQLSPLARIEARLPITFYLSHRTSGDCYLMHDHAIEVARQLGLTDSQPRDGKLWVGAALARAFAKEYPTLVQFVIT